ncbi:MAG: hypothetical protein FRX49_04983 [Trebouxia sp. A1-2]|nr:MAG: hypothetical protein FRX49_04983 [Trebouxia sp. A1-2]
MTIKATVVFSMHAMAAELSELADYTHQCIADVCFAAAYCANGNQQQEKSAMPVAEHPVSRGAASRAGVGLH